MKIGLGVLCAAAYLLGTAAYATVSDATPENPRTSRMVRALLTPAFAFWRAVLPKTFGGGGN